MLADSAGGGYWVRWGMWLGFIKFTFLNHLPALFLKFRRVNQELSYPAAEIVFDLAPGLRVSLTNVVSGLFGSISGDKVLDRCSGAKRHLWEAASEQSHAHLAQSKLSVLVSRKFTDLAFEVKRVACG